MPAELDARAPLGTLIALFTLGDRVARADLQRALGEVSVDSLGDAGLLDLDGDHVRSPFSAEWLHGLMLFGDGADEDDRDHVAAVYGASSRFVADLTPRGEYGSMLDLGTGAGLHALLASRHCARVVGVDVNPRALELAELNARVNGAGNAEWRHGSWLEPVAGERFDLIVCNPPYVVSPDDEFTFRDSAMPGGELVAQLCSDMPGHLSDGGVAVIVGMWPHATRDDWDARPRAWVTAAGCDAIVVCLDTSEALRDAVAWNSPPARVLHPGAFHAAVTRWHLHHRDLNAAMVSFGAIVLRRSDGTDPWSLFARPTDQSGRHAGRQIERAIAGNDLLRSGKLSGRRCAVPEGLTVSQRFARRDDAWTVKAATVGIKDELGLGAAIAPAVLDVLFQRGGTLGLDELPGPAAEQLLSRGLLDVL